MRNFVPLFAFMLACLVVGFVAGQNMAAIDQVRLFEVVCP